MSWTAPEIERIDEPAVAGELDMFVGWLDTNRTALLHKCAGLTGEQLAQWAVPPSNLSLLGLVRHITDMERTWFRVRYRGEDVDKLYPGRDECFEAADPEHAERDLERLTAEWELSRKALDGAVLTDTFEWDGVGTMSLRWMLHHVIGEYARHLGHADLLRERIDGRTGL
ncbi:DinB family protein [Actinocatenispora rupis]|uniref:DinB superfamily protein n=1 Tax=Actinocatenispora rupis TaxID=519421 RepID=A0A8J3J3V2_9ACTN|nr:DinB family protein [Actinocatenispora rupis]GID11131.1 hypothetical protein Aru02nite_20200 [Actinocatenispora rupis]